MISLLAIWQAISVCCCIQICAAAQHLEPESAKKNGHADFQQLAREELSLLAAQRQWQRMARVQGGAPMRRLAAKIPGQVHQRVGQPFLVPEVDRKIGWVQRGEGVTTKAAIAALQKRVNG